MPILAPLVAGLLACQIPTPGEGASRRAAGLRAELAAIRSREATALEDLAARLDRDGRAEPARSVRAMIDSGPGPAGPIRLAPMPELVPPRPPRATEPGPWEGEASSIRTPTVRALIELAASAAAKGADRLGIADECLRGALDRDPGHPEARRLLGYLPFEGGWATTAAIDFRKKGRVLDPTYGWVSKDWLPRLAERKLPARNPSAPWIPEAEADALRDRIDRGWKIDSAPHFTIQTDVPLSEAIVFGRRLEAVHGVFLGLFADVLGPEYSPLARRFRNQAPIPKKPSESYYFRDKTEYVDYMRGVQHRDESTSLGIYLIPGQVRGKADTKSGRSFFYRDPKAPIDVVETLYHEASHQLLFESAGTSLYGLNGGGNYWIWEGLGTYFETMRIGVDGSIEIGGLVGPRVEAAKGWILRSNRYIPIGQFAALDRDHFLVENDEVYLHYAEAMVLTVFFMHAEGGKYRDSFLDYVTDAYRGRLRSARALETRLGASSAALDREFLAWFDRHAGGRP